MERRPLVLNNGIVAELPSIDTLIDTAVDSLKYRQSLRIHTAATNCTAISTIALAANTLRAYPLIVTKPMTISSITMAVTTLVAGALMRAGIYTDNGNCYPGTLVANSDINVFSGSAVAVVSVVPLLNIVLAPGLYWIAVNSSGTQTVRGLAAAAIAPVIGLDPLTLTAMGNAYSSPLAFGVMPVTYPVNIAPTFLSVLPLVGLKIV